LVVRSCGPESYHLKPPSGQLSCRYINRPVTGNTRATGWCRKVGSLRLTSVTRADTADKVTTRASEWPVIETWREDDSVYVNVRELSQRDRDEAASEPAAEFVPAD
jgi:hypothetical protein